MKITIYIILLIILTSAAYCQMPDTDLLSNRVQTTGLYKRTTDTKTSIGAGIIYRYNRGVLTSYDDIANCKITGTTFVVYDINKIPTLNATNKAKLCILTGTQITETIIFGMGNVKLSRQTITFSADKKTKTTTNYDASDTITSIDIKHYNVDNLMDTEKDYDNNNLLINTITYSYDVKKNLLKYIVYNSNNQVIKTISYSSYGYNEYGDWGCRTETTTFPTINGVTQLPVAVLKIRTMGYWAS